MSVREQALGALRSLIHATVASDTMRVERNYALLARLDGSVIGMANLLDGDSTLDAETLGEGGSFDFTHRARLEVIVLASTPDADAQLDATIAAIDAALVNDRLLGGLVDWAQIGPPLELGPEHMELAIDFRVSVHPIELIYTAPTAAG